MSAGTISMSKRTRQILSAWLTLAAGLLGLAVGLVSFAIKPELSSYGDAAYQQGQIQAIIEKVAELRVEQDGIKKALTKPSATLDVNTLSQRIEVIEQRQRVIEQALMNNPAKALEVPLLRNDLDNLKDTNAQNLAAIKSSVDQVYDLNKWLLGAMALAIVGLALTRLLTAKVDQNA